MEENQSLDERIAEWRDYLNQRMSVKSIDVDELEDHLRTQVESLSESGLDDDEAFLVGVKRLGSLDLISREFAQEYSERLWKQLVLAEDTEGSATYAQKDSVVAVSLAIAAGVAIKLPQLFGFSFAEDDESMWFYLRNFSFFVLPLLAGYFAWKRGIGRLNRLWLAIPFAVGVIVMNILPINNEGHTLILAAIHLPIALWLSVGIAYASGNWRDHEQRMNFVRFTGEWFIYYILIALGGGVLMMFVMFTFQSIGLDAEGIVQSWMLPCGVMGAIIISAYLVEAKQSIIENMAPVLTRLFTPLFTLLLLAFLGAMIWTGSSIKVERDVLIGFDLLLVLVLGLLLYSISVRDANAPAGAFDLLQFLLVVSALIVDVLALLAIVSRISEFGFSPNKVAALGENLILLINLGWSAVLYGRFLLKRSPFTSLERWQTLYMPVYAVWAWIVVLLFPILFRFQ